MQNEATRGYFTERARQEGNSALGQAMRRWLANPNDGAAADSIEANPLEVGTHPYALRRDDAQGRACGQCACRRCAQATVNCRIFPGVQPKDVQAELQKLVGPNIEVTPDPSYIGAADAGITAARRTCSRR